MNQASLTLMIVQLPYLAAAALFGLYDLWHLHLVYNR